MKSSYWSLFSVFTIYWIVEAGRPSLTGQTASPGRKPPLVPPQRAVVPQQQYPSSPLRPGAVSPRQPPRPFTKVQQRPSPELSHPLVNPKPALAVIPSGNPAVQEQRGLLGLWKTLRSSLPSLPAQQQSLVVMLISRTPVGAMLNIMPIWSIFNVGYMMYNSPDSIQTWSYVLLNLSSLAIGLSIASVPMMCAQLGMSAITLFMSKQFPGVWEAFAFKTRSILGNIYGYLKEKLLRVISRVAMSFNKICQRQPTEEQSALLGTAVAKTTGMIQDSNEFVILINAAQYAELKLKIQKITTAEKFLEALRTAHDYPCDEAIYLLIKHLRKIKFNHTEKLEILRLLGDPEMSGAFLPEVLNLDEFKGFADDMIVSHGADPKLPSFAEHFFPLCKPPRIVSGGQRSKTRSTEAVNRTILAIEALIKASLWDKHRDALTCVFIRLISPEIAMECEMGSIKQFIEETEGFSKALDIAIRKSFINSRLFKQNLGTNLRQNPLGKRGVNHFAMANELIGIFRANMGGKKPIDLLKHPGIFELLLRSEKPVGPIEMHSANPLTFSLYLARVRPDPNTLVSVGGRPGNEALDKVYRRWFSGHRHVRLGPCEDFDFGPKLEQVLLGDLYKGFGWDKLRLDTKGAIVDLVIQLFFGVHPDRITTVQPIRHMPFMAQLRKRFKLYCKRKNVAYSQASYKSLKHQGGKVSIDAS